MGGEGEGGRQKWHEGSRPKPGDVGEPERLGNEPTPFTTWEPTSRSTGSTLFACPPPVVPIHTVRVVKSAAPDFGRKGQDGGALPCLPDRPLSL